jgi:hypothetical protein
LGLACRLCAAWCPLTLFFCAQAIDELKVAVECHDENFVSLRRSLFELQRSLKSPAINNNVLLKHLETCITSKVRCHCALPPRLLCPQQSQHFPP